MMTNTAVQPSSLERLGMQDFCFATLCTSGYLSYTSGLYLNLKKFYPDLPLVVCTLDRKAQDFFNRIGDPLLKTVNGNDIWGEEYWRNMRCRMKGDERCFASKPAIMEWTLEHGYKHALFIDSDILLLDRIDDIIRMLSKHDCILTPARFTLESWRKSRVGNFNAGLFGFSCGCLRQVKMYKALCFDRCVNLQIDNLFFEQKFLDLFGHYNNTGIIRDLGINVMGSDFNELKPHLGDDGNWHVIDGTKIRLFHATTPTPRDFPLVQQKLSFDRESFATLSGAQHSNTQDRVAIKKKLRITNFLKNIGISWFSNKLWISILSAIKVFQDFNRVISLSDEFNLSTRFRETFFRKEALLEKLKDSYRKKG